MTLDKLDYRMPTIPALENRRTQRLAHPAAVPSSRRAWRLAAATAALCIIITGCGGDKGTSPNNYPVPGITVPPEVTAITSDAATITWVTDTEASTTVRYGLLSGQYLYKDSSATAVTQHSVRLTNLRSKTTYYYFVSSRAKGGYVKTEEGTFVTALGARDLVPAAWEEYKGGRITAAITLFNQLRVLEPQNHEAFSGLGWCYANGAVDSLEKALTLFNGAIAIRSTWNDAIAGKGFVELALNMYGPAVSDFSRLLSLAPNYLFAHDARVNTRAVRLGLAEAHFYLQAFDAAREQIEVLAPGNGLDPAQPATWSADGVSYATWPEALLAWIEKLKRQG